MQLKYLIFFCPILLLKRWNVAFLIFPEVVEVEDRNKLIMSNTKVHCRVSELM